MKVIYFTEKVRSNMKLMLICFFSVKGVTHKESVSQSLMVNSKFPSTVMFWSGFENKFNGNVLRCELTNHGVTMCQHNDHLLWSHLRIWLPLLFTRHTPLRLLFLPQNKHGAQVETILNRRVDSKDIAARAERLAKNDFKQRFRALSRRVMH